MWFYCFLIINHSNKHISRSFILSKNKQIIRKSNKTINKCFREGIWFRITNEDTTEEFKQEYKIKEAERKAKKMREYRIEILTNAINMVESVPQEEKNRHIKGLQNMSGKELERLIGILFNQFK